MDVTLDCSISLSKKLRALFGDEEVRIVMVADPIKEGRGRANIILSSEKIDMSALKSLMNQETSLMFTPFEEKREDVSSSTITGLFCGSPSATKPSSSKRNPIDRLAVTEPPEKKNVAHAVKTREEIDVPREFEEIKNPEYKNFVSTLAELMDAVKQAQMKDSGIDIDSITDIRKKAVAMEAKERMESIDVPAFIVTEKCAAVRINDLNISLMLNVPYNLCNISAKRLVESRDLRALLNSNMIRFVDPKDVDTFIEKAQQDVEKPSLQTYDRKGAEKAISSQMPDSEEMEVSVNEIDDPTDQESLVTNLTPIETFDGSEGHVRITNYSAGQPRIRKNVPETANKNKAGLSSIRRTGIEYK